jgi:hypothetical protein
MALLRSMELLKRPPDLSSFPRYLRKYLPDTDFAASSEPFGLALNRKARGILKANRLLTDAELVPASILDRAPRGVQDLDRRYGRPKLPLAPEQLVAIRRLEAAAWAQHLAHPKPPRAPDLNRALSLLRACKRRAPARFTRPAPQKAIDEGERELGREIPAAWQKVLRISNGGRVESCPLAAGNACLIMPIEKLAKNRQAERAYYRELGARLPAALLPVMTTELGDSVWLDTSRPRGNSDCRVVLMSHETGEEERAWTSVAEFLEEVLVPEADQ